MNQVIKILISIVLIFGLKTYPKSSVEFQNSLKEDYNTFNNGYFDGKLPDIPVTYISVENADIGDTKCEWGLGGATSCRIFINAYYDRDRREADLTLFHEMCHIATAPSFDAHGPAWQKCMHNLANAGAFDDLW